MLFSFKEKIEPYDSGQPGILTNTLVGTSEREASFEVKCPERV